MEQLSHLGLSLFRSFGSRDNSAGGAALLPFYDSHNEQVMPCNLNEYSLCILLVFTESVCMCMFICVCVCLCVVFFFSLTVYLILVINITTSRCVPQSKPNINPVFSHYQ